MITFVVNAGGQGTSLPAAVNAPKGLLYHTPRNDITTQIMALGMGHNGSFTYSGLLSGFAWSRYIEEA